MVKLIIKTELEILHLGQDKFSLILLFSLIGIILIKCLIIDYKIPHLRIFSISIEQNISA